MRRMVKDRGGVGWGVRCGVRGIQMEYEVEVEWEVYEEYGVWWWKGCVGGCVEEVQKGKTIPHRGFPCGHPPEY